MVDMNANWLKERREQLRLSQEDMLTLLQLEGVEVSRSMISHWETGRYHLPLTDVKTMRAIAKTLKVSITDLLVAEGYDLDADEVLASLTIQERLAIRAWRRGDKAEAAKIILNG